MTSPFAHPRFVRSGDGVAIALYDLDPGSDDRPALLWGHAAGFSAEMYEPFLRRVTRAFRIFAYDIRGHGRSDVPPAPLERSLSMTRLTEDLGAVAAAVRAAIGGRPLLLATHSLAGAPALRSAWQLGALAWDRLVAFDPPVFPPPGHPLHDRALAHNRMLAEGARRRRVAWDSPQSFHDSLAARAPFDTWDVAMLGAYVRGSLKEEAQRWVLRCPPEVEATLYETVQEASTLRNLAAYRGPLWVVSADRSLPAAGWLAEMVPAIRTNVTTLRHQELPGRGHMMMFEDPALCAGRLIACASLP